MDIKEILRRVDHTLLRVDATEKEIAVICDDALKYGCASVCIPCSYVGFAAHRLAGRVAVCTTIGFPNGYNTTEVKVLETLDALKNGADEIDMVINVGFVKDGKYDLVLEEIKAVRAACEGKILKVIIETCLLNDEEIVKLCDIVGRSGADYIKTSTGFSTAGATREAVALMRKHSPQSLKIKAAGGIKTLEDAEAFIELGADRLGTSRIVTLVKG